MSKTLDLHKKKKKSIPNHEKYIYAYNIHIYIYICWKHEITHLALTKTEENYSPGQTFGLSNKTRLQQYNPKERNGKKYCQISLHKETDEQSQSRYNSEKP